MVNQEGAAEILTYSYVNFLLHIYVYIIFQWQINTHTCIGALLCESMAQNEYIVY